MTEELLDTVDQRDEREDPTRENDEVLTGEILPSPVSDTEVYGEDLDGHTELANATAPMQAVAFRARLANHHVLPLIDERHDFDAADEQAHVVETVSHWVMGAPGRIFIRVTDFTEGAADWVQRADHAKASVEA